MKDFLLPLASAVPFLAAMSREDMSFWEKIAEKWGIGVVGLGLFCGLAWWTAKRETALQQDRDAKEAANQAERINLLARNNELQAELLKAVNSHAKTGEQLSRDGIKASNDHAAALRMLVRKMQRPCVAPIDLDALEKNATE